MTAEKNTALMYFLFVLKKIMLFCMPILVMKEESRLIFLHFRGNKLFFFCTMPKNMKKLFPPLMCGKKRRGEKFSEKMFPH